MNELRLTKSGFERWRWNGDLKSKHRLKKQDDDSVIVYDRETKEEIDRYPSMEKAEEVYWEQDEGGSMLTILRSGVDIDDGVTVTDFINAIKMHEDLHITCDNLFGVAWEFNAPTSCPVEVYRIGEVSDDVLTWHNRAYEDRASLSNDILKVRKRLIITAVTQPAAIDSLEDIEGEGYMSVLDIMEALFCDPEEERPLLHFMHNGNDTGIDGPPTLNLPTGEEVESEDALDYLLHPIQVFDDDISGFSVNQLFKWVARSKALTEFISAYSWCWAIDGFHTEADLPSKAADLENDDEHWGKIKRTEVYRHIEIDRYVRRGQDSTSINDSMDFTSWGDTSKETRKWYTDKYEISWRDKKGSNHTRVFRSPSEVNSEEEARAAFEKLGIEGAFIREINFVENKDECPDEERYGVGMSPAYHYSHLPLKLREKIEIRRSPVYSRKGRCLEKGGVVDEVTANPTLLEFLDAIYWEISFYGGPEGRDDQKEELCERVGEIKNRDSDNPEDWRVKTFATYEEMMDYDSDEDPEGPYDAYTVDHELDDRPDDPPEDFV